LTDPLDFPPGAAADDDPAVLDGMERLRILRAAEGDVVEFVKPPA
jgi:hypothetical protein